MKYLCFIVENSVYICFCTEMNFNDQTNTAEIIDQMFDKVLEYAAPLEEENEDYTEDHDGDIGACSVDRDKMNTESEKNEQEYEKTEDTEDELLTFPPSGILSPLSKSVEAVVTPLVRPTLAVNCCIHQ